MDTPENESSRTSELVGETAEPDERIRKPPYFKQRINSLLWKAHLLAPNLLTSPYEDKAYTAERDADENRKSAIPGGQGAALACIWATELYGPTEIESLYAGLRNLGWDAKWHDPDGGAVSWIARQRMYGSSGYYSIGWVFSKDDAKKFVGRDYSAEFPKEFSNLIVEVYQVSPSLTCLVVAFVLKEEASSIYRDVLNLNYFSINRRIKGRKGGYRILSPYHHKREMVDRVRNRYRKLAFDWIRGSMPGYFAASADAEHCPTAELLITTGIDTLDREAAKGLDYLHWSTILKLEHGFESWRSSSSPSLAFSLEGRGFKPTSHSIVKINSDLLTDQDFFPSADRGWTSQVNFAHRNLHGVLSIYAVVCYLREVRRSLGEIREKMQLIDRKHQQSELVLSKLERFFYSIVGVPHIAAELLKVSESKRAFDNTVSGFTAVPLFPGSEKGQDISVGFKSVISSQASHIASEERDTRDFLEQYASVLGIKESLRAQKRMESLTRWTVGLSVLTAILAFAALMPMLL